MRIAFIVQRYGAEILGGSEYACRLSAEHLSTRHEVEVLTTCAREYTTWENAYPESSDRIRGVTVRRFANAQTRNLESFNAYSDWIFSNPHTATDEEAWLQQQGPWCPALIEYLQQKHKSYDALIFFTYLYAPTVLGLHVDPKRSILVPDGARRAGDPPGHVQGRVRPSRSHRLHDQRRAQLPPQSLHNQGQDLKRPLSAASTCRRTSTRVVRHLQAATVTTRDRRVTTGPRRPAAPAARCSGAVTASTGPFVLYGGRIDPGKGCEELIEYFSTYADAQGDATLALMGIKLMPIPEEPFIRFAGMLSETERLDALEAATVVVVPSPYESLSLLALGVVYGGNTSASE